MKSTAKRKIVWAVAGLVGLGAASAHADSVVQLTLTVNTATNSWSVFEQNLNPSDTVGLDGLGFDVVGSGGILVSSASNRMLIGSDNEIGNTGFFNFKTNGTITAGTAHDISGFQNAGSYSTNSLNDVSNVYTGVGNMAESINTGYTGGDGVNDPGATPVFKNAALPVLLATGKYTGTFGTLTVTSDPTRVALLPSQANYPPNPGPSGTSATYQTHSPTAVQGQTVQIGSVPAAPLPASAMGGGLLLAGLGMARRLRRAQSVC